MNADKTDWADHISMVEFNYINIKYSGNGFSLFMVVLRTELLFYVDLALKGTSVKDRDEGEVVETKFFLEGAQSNIGVSKEDLAKGSKRLQKVSEFQGRAQGVAECEELQIVARPKAQVHS